MKENSVEDFDSLFVEKRSSVKFAIYIIIFSVLLLTAIYTYLSVSAVRDRMKIAHDQAQGSPEFDSSLF